VAAWCASAAHGPLDGEGEEWRVFTDVGPLELITLAVLAVLLFGPDKLPEFIQNTVGLLRKVREFSESAKREVRSELGPEFQDFEFEDLHPKTFLRKHVLDDGGLGLDGIRGALDPSKELTEIADAVRRDANGHGPEDPATVNQASLTKTTALSAKADDGATPTAPRTFDPDAT
jgi:sec-independent protein translocase protein TatB